MLNAYPMLVQPKQGSSIYHILKGSEKPGETLLKLLEKVLHHLGLYTDQVGLIIDSLEVLRLLLSQKGEVFKFLKQVQLLKGNICKRT